MGNDNGSLKSTIAVSLTNYLDAGAIVAGASGLTLWQKYLGLTEVHLGWLNFISANCLGAASVPSSADSLLTNTAESSSIPTTCLSI